MYNRDFKAIFVDEPSGNNEDIMRDTFKNGNKRGRKKRENKQTKKC